MNNFSEALFPLDISYGMRGGPRYSTNLDIARSGQEYRNINWQKPKYEYKLSYAIKNKDQMEKLIIFFRNHKGRAIGFRFRDFSDFTAANENLMQIDSDKFQLVKRYGLDVRVIKKPVANSLNLFALDTKLPSSEYDIDYSSGVVTINNLRKFSKSPIKANFEFDVPVRFDSDYLPCDAENHGIYSFYDISLIEIL